VRFPEPDGYEYQPYRTISEAGEREFPHERFLDAVAYEFPPVIVPAIPPVAAEAIAPPTPGVTSSDQAISSHPSAVPHQCQAREVICAVIQDERSHQLLMRTGFFDKFLKILDEEKAKGGPHFGNDMNIY